jgi:hypothetical protein
VICMVGWAHEHWFLTFILVYVLIKGAFMIVRLLLRTLIILTRGWPTSSNMDIEGDIKR